MPRASAPRDTGIDLAQPPRRRRAPDEIDRAEERSVPNRIGRFASREPNPALEPRRRAICEKKILGAVFVPPGRFAELLSHRRRSCIARAPRVALACEREKDRIPRGFLTLRKKFSRRFSPWTQSSLRLDKKIEDAREAPAALYRAVHASLSGVAVFFVVL